jgi:hypothetical protein
MHHLALITVVAMLGGTPEAAAQATRAEEVRAKREAKARQVQPVKRGWLDATLFKVEDSLLIERVLFPPRGIHLRLGGIGEGAGFGAGPAFRYSTDQFDFRISAAASMKRYAIGEAALLLPGVVRDGPYFELYGRRRDFPEEDFYGLGPTSAIEDRSNYAVRDTLVRATPGLRRGPFTAGVGVSFLDGTIGRGTDKLMPPTQDVFTAESVPGLAAQPTFAIVEPFVEVNYADPPLNPGTGGHYRFSYSRHNDRDLDRFTFTRWDVDLRQYLPLFHETRTIALRAWLASADPESGHDVPFYLQPTLGGAYSLRGVRTFRFRDRSALLLQAEYRWRINNFMAGALFYDTGAVAPRLSDLGSLERDYGFGIRLGGRTGVAFRADVAFGSNEGNRILLRFNNVF